MKKLKLSQNKVALVDDCYYPMLKTLGKWCIQSSNYAATRHRGKLILLHRLIWEWKYGFIPKGKTIDHINRNALNNQLSNLRLATPTQQVLNIKKKSNNTSGYRGVFWSKKARKWFVQFKFNGKLYYGGLFRNKKQAAIQYLRLVEEIVPNAKDWINA
jgi:hypothetical protein